MHIGLCTIADEEAPVDRVLEVAADAGYDGVELWGGEHVGDGSPDTCERIRTAADRRGLEIPVYGSYLRPGTPDYEDDVDEELAIANRLEASSIRVWAGEEEYQERREDHWDATVDDLLDLSTRAADLGLAVTVEKHEGTLTNTATGACRLLEAVDRENCGLNWQPLFGLSAETILAEASDLGPLANNVHVQAVPESGASWRDRCLLEEAFFDLPAILEALDEAGFDGALEVEFVTDDLPFAAAARRDRAHLASILRSIET